MGLDGEDAPTATDIQNQLQKILESNTFRASERHSNLIAYLVQKDASHEDVKETTLIADLFPEYLERHLETETDIARVTVTHLRKRLKDYYDGEGENDPVVIEVAKRGYKPCYSFNKRLPQNLLYQEGIFHRAYEFRFDARASTESWAFERAIQARPAFAEAHAALAESRLVELLTNFHDPVRDRLKQAKDSAEAAIALNPHLPLPYIVLGAIECCHWNWGDASEWFKIAESKSKLGTVNNLWHAAYRLAISTDGTYSLPMTSQEFLARYPRVKEVLKTTRSLARGGIGDSFTRALHTVFLYVTRRPSAGTTTFDVTNDWLSRLIHNVCSLAEHPELKRIPNPCTVDEFDQFITSQANRFAGYPCPGLGIVFAAFMLPDNEVASERFAELLKFRERRYVRPLQVALGYMALGDHNKALGQLELACEEHDPFLAWLHLWPILDPIRDYPAFKALIRAMRLPYPG